MAHTKHKAAHDAKRGLSEWQRRVAVDIAAAFPLTPVALIRATGNSLAAENDEPEPTTADDMRLAEVAVESPTEYAQRRARDNDLRALEGQVLSADAMRKAGWL